MDIITKEDASLLFKEFLINPDLYRKGEKRDQVKIAVKSIFRSTVKSRHGDIKKCKELFGLNLFLARTSLYLSYADLNYFTGIDAQTIKKIEEGRTEPKLSHINRLACCLLIQPQMFFLNEEILNTFQNNACIIKNQKLKIIRKNIFDKFKKAKINKVNELTNKCNYYVSTYSPQFGVKNNIQSSIIGSAIGTYFCGYEGFFLGLEASKIYKWDPNISLDKDIDMNIRLKNI